MPPVESGYFYARKKRILTVEVSGSGDAPEVLS